MSTVEDAPTSWDALSDAHDADLIAWFGPISAPGDRSLLALLEGRQLRKNVILWLATYGGDPHVAYRISRTLQRHYKTYGNETDTGRFTVFVDTMCKSAGTIIVLGSDKLVMSDYAELGPIDPQLRKPDEGRERSSSLTTIQSLSALQSSSFELFHYYFRQLRSDTAWNLTTDTASKLAANMTVGLMGPIYNQIDPIKLGEIDRFTKVSLRYGAALANGNLKEDAVERLVAGYPSHSFVIDRREAKELFNNVEEPDEKFKALSTSRAFTEAFLTDDSPVIMFLNNDSPKPAAAAQAVAEDENK